MKGKGAGGASGPRVSKYKGSHGLLELKDQQASQSKTRSIFSRLIHRPSIFHLTLIEGDFAYTVCSRASRISWQTCL